MTGPECSLIALCDGARAVPLPLAQDHKRIGEGDTGPNTGGMGAYAPAPVAATTADALTATFVQPVLDHLAAAGTPYVGVLYAGLMLTADGPATGRVQLPLRRPRGPGACCRCSTPTSPSWPWPAAGGAPRRRAPLHDARRCDVHRRRRRARLSRHRPRVGDLVDAAARARTTPSIFPAGLTDGAHHRRAGARRHRPRRRPRDRPRQRLPHALDDDRLRRHAGAPRHRLARARRRRSRSLRRGRASTSTRATAPSRR